MFSFFRMTVSFIKEFGGFGFGLANFCLVCFVSFKLFTNHLAHIQKDIKSNGKKLDNLDVKVDKNTERIATIEGKISK